MMKSKCYGSSKSTGTVFTLLRVVRLAIIMN